jgi:hypothetical protein
MRKSSRPRRPLRNLLSRLSLGWLIFLAATVLAERDAAAEFELASSHGWTLTSDGRVNIFLSIARGAAIPKNEQNYTGLDEEATPDNTIESSRMRTGFMMSILGFNLNKTLAPGLAVKARVGLWMLASSGRNYAADEPPVNSREVYFKIEGPWGGFLGGRAMSIFSRGAILIDYDIEHNYGLGHPCTTRSVSGGACGHSGFGVLFPGFHAGAVYNTPDLGGLQISAGLYDPSALGEGAYRRTPLPRVEAEVSFKAENHFRAFAGALWQRVSRNKTVTDPVTMMDTPASQDVDATGVSYGLMATAGPVNVGFSGYFGKGLGLYTPLEDNPINIISSTGELRKQNGYYGAASLTFGETKVAGGVGISRLTRADEDPPDTGNSITPKQQLGYSVGFYQGFNRTVVAALEYFRAETTWFDRGEPMGADLAIVRPRQSVNFFNVGATLYW